MTESALVAELAALCRTVGAARLALDAGNLVDLTGLDGVVAGLCAAAGELPVSQQREAAQGLARLADDLAGLAAALAEQKAALERAEEASARRRAAGAYGDPPADSSAAP